MSMCLRTTSTQALRLVRPPSVSPSLHTFLYSLSCPRGVLLSLLLRCWSFHSLFLLLPVSAAVWLTLLAAPRAPTAGKLACFNQIIARFGGEEESRFIAVGDGLEEAEISEELDLPFHQIDQLADLKRLDAQIDARLRYHGLDPAASSS